MSVLTERVCRTIDRHRLIPPGARVIAAVSGGADSTAMVRLLLEAAPLRRFEVVALAHFNHLLRGAASDADEAFCREMAAGLALGFESARGDVRAAARAWGASLEDAGRRLRYEFLAAAASRAGAGRVAVGHTLDDQAETLLLNLLRGAGTTGIGGMPPAVGIVVRPLLDCRHDELVAWLSHVGVPFREDESNLDRRFLRNRIRHDVIPSLVRVAPAAAAALARAAVVARAEGEHLDGEAREALTRVTRQAADGALALDADLLVALPLALARRVARLALARHSGGRFVGFDHVERFLALAAEPAAAPADLPGQRVERTRDGVLRLTPAAARRGRTAALTSSSGNSFRAPLSIPGEVDLGAGLALSSDFRPGGLADLGGAARDTAVLDAELVADLAVRFRRPGDTFRPLGLDGSKKLQDFFVDRRVPRSERDRVPLVVDGDDRVVWVAGHEVSEAVRVSGRTRAVVILKLRGERG